MKVGYYYNNKKTITNFLSGKKEGRRKISCGFFFKKKIFKRFFEILAHKLKQTLMFVVHCFWCGESIGTSYFGNPNSKGYFDPPSHIYLEII